MEPRILEPRIAPDQIRNFTGAVFVIGLGSLFLVENFFFPGILFVIALTVMLNQWAQGRGLFANPAAYWLIVFGVISAIELNSPAVLGLILMGGGGFILSRILFQSSSLTTNSHDRPSAGQDQAHSQKPFVDNTLD